MTASQRTGRSSAEYFHEYQCAHRDQVNAKNREWYDRNGERIRAQKRAYEATPERKAKRHAYYEATKASRKTKDRAYYAANRLAIIMRQYGRTLADGEALFAAQDGRCGLTGRPLNQRAMHLDHIVPRKRGGSDELSNLRWVAAEANRMKRDLLEAELLALCREILEWSDR